MTALAQRKHSDAWASILLLLLAFCGLNSIYRLTVFLWMARAQPAYTHVWLMQIWVWLAVSLLLGVSWIALFLMLVRHGHQSK